MRKAGRQEEEPPVVFLASWLPPSGCYGLERSGLCSFSNRFLPPVALRSFVRQTSGTKQRGQLLNFFAGQVAQLPGMTLADRFAQRLQKGQPRFGDADTHHSAIVRGAVTLNESAFLQFVEQASNIRRPGDEPAGQVQSTDLLRVFAA